MSLVSGWKTSRVMYLNYRSRMNVVVPPQLGPLNYFNLGFEAIKPDHFRKRAVGMIKRREAEEKFQCHNGAQGTGTKFECTPCKRREKETPYGMQDEWDGNGNSNAKMGTKRDTKLERKEKLEQEGKNSMQKGNKRRHKNCVEKITSDRTEPEGAGRNFQCKEGREADTRLTVLKICNWDRKEHKRVSITNEWERR